MLFKVLIFSICTIGASIDSWAQRTQDTISFNQPSFKNKPGSKKIFYGEPGKAALYSLILPGAGQLYNKRWWKVPLVYTLEGAAVYNMINSRNTYNKWNNCYIGLVEGTIPTDCGSVSDTSTAFRVRNSARNNRDLSYIFLGLAHLLQVVDAFVDRHLINFDTTDDLSFRFQDQSPIEAQITFPSISRPLNSRHSTRIPSLNPTR